MRWGLPLIPLVLAVSGCSFGASAPAQPTATTTTTAATPGPPTPRPTPLPHVSRAYRDFLGQLCGALAAGNAGAVMALLPNYQYNSGVYYGTLGSGEGQTGDPSLIRGWLAGAHVRCHDFTPDVAGHGTLLTGGWPTAGGWNLIDLDTFNGHWKINDFTFGGPSGLWRAMHVAGPILPYHG